MLNFIISHITKIDVKIKNVIYKTFEFSLILLIIATYILFLYCTYPISFDLLNSSILIFKTAITIAVSGFISGFAINSINNI